MYKMLIWTSIIFILITISVTSNHPLQDDSDPEIVEARRTQVLSGSTQHYYQQEDEENNEDEIKSEKDEIRGGRTSSSRGQTRSKFTLQRNIQARKDDVDHEEVEEKEKVLSEESNSKNRSSKNERTRSKSDDDHDVEDESSSKATNASTESKSNKTLDEIKAKKEESNLEVSSPTSLSSSSSSQSQQKLKTVNDSHKNYTRLEPVRGRKSFSSSSSLSGTSASTSSPTTFRRQRTPSHIQPDVTSETPESISESTQNSKKRRRLLTTSTSTTATPQTMPYNLYNHFRPLDQDVPQDHLLPFLDFGKKLSPGIPPTPSGLNSIENKSINQRHRSKEHVAPEYRSTTLDEDVLFHEDMDVTVQKKTIERNNVPRVKIQQLRDPFISGYYRKRPTTISTTTSTTTTVPTTVEPSESTINLKNSENFVTNNTDCSLRKIKNESGNIKTSAREHGDSDSGLYYKHNSRTIMPEYNDSKCELNDNTMLTTTIKNVNKKLITYNRDQINENIGLTRNVTNNRYINNLNNGKILDVEHIKTNLSNPRVQKFERMKIEPSQSTSPSFETTTTNVLTGTTKRILPIKLQLRNRNLNSTSVNTKNDTKTITKNLELQKSTADPLIHEESNNYEKTANSSEKQEPLQKPQKITTISPTSQQLTTRILSTAVVTSVSVKESLSKNDNVNSNINETINDEESLPLTNDSTASNIDEDEAKRNNFNNQEILNQKENRKPEKLPVNEEKNSHKPSDFSDSTISGSSTKPIIKPTESTVLNNRTIPEDFIEVPRVNTKNPRPTTTPFNSTENVSRREYNKTIIGNPLYKPKIVLPRTKVIISSTTPRASTLVPLTKLTRTPTVKPKLDEKISSKENNSTVQAAPTKFQTRMTTANPIGLSSTVNLLTTNITNDTTVSSEITSTTTELPMNKSSDRDDSINKNPTTLPSSSNTNYSTTEGNLKTNNTSYTESKQKDNPDDTIINTEEILEKEKRLNDESSRKINAEFDDLIPLHGEIPKNHQENDGSDSSKSEIELPQESNDPNEGVPEEKTKETSGIHEDSIEFSQVSTSSIPDKVSQRASTPRITTTYPIVHPPLSTPASALDHKWLHNPGTRTSHNFSVTDGQHTDVGVAYPESVHIATYVLTGLGIIPILLLAVIIARVFIIRNRKKVLDESEYSSEYNRSPLGNTSSPLPTKLPRVPAHLGWEVEKNPPLPPIPVTSTRWEFPRDKLRLQTVLGQGNFGQVWKAEADDISGHEGLTRLVAVKTVKEGASNREREDLLRELGIMQELGAHPNVVTLLGCCTEKEPYLLIMEYVMYGKLLAFLRDHRTRAHYYNFSESTDALTSRDLTVFAYCVARGLDYLTTKGIIHRDIAARNVLVDHNKLCKIADFGMSRNVRDTGQIYEQRQSKGALPIRWMAPESLHFSLFTHKTDVWSFGILMWEIVTLGSTPYANMGAREVMRRVREGYRLDRPAHCHQEFFRVIQRCWHSEPAKRPTFAELKHELGNLLGDSEHGGGYVDLEGLAEEIKHHNHSGASTLQRPHNH